MPSFFSSLGSSSKPVTESKRIFYVEKSPNDPTHVFLRDAYAPSNGPPMRSVIFNKSGNGPDVLFFQAFPHPNNQIGHTTQMSSFSGTAELNLKGLSVTLRKSLMSMSESYKVGTQQRGNFKWKPNLLRTEMELVDEQGGTVLAKFNTGAASFGGGGERKELHIFEHVDEFLLDMILFSGMTARRLQKDDVVGMLA